MIRILDQRVADAIAAGEVVERPAAVVKELVENALDAGAQRISISLAAAGKSLIRVADDGHGIPKDELSLAFRRHATSKIQDLDDLARIGSLGFRGEALASIAAVAEVECRSLAARVRLRHGEVTEEGAAMPTPGTVLEVRDLFSNTPARLRFLKSDATETAACSRLVQSYALLYPEVRFEMTVDGRRSLRTTGEGPAAALAAVLGSAVAERMLAVAGEGVSGHAAHPSAARATREGILIAVNRRPITSRALVYAVEEAYTGLLERDRHPVTVLTLELDPAQVDVNVHPTKREVRFRDEGQVFSRLQRAVRAALAEATGFRLAVGGLAPAPLDATQPWLSASARSGLDAPQTQPTTPPRPVEPTPDGNRSLGQVHQGYLVAEGADGIYLIDQHAAHERILFNRIKARLARGGVASQPLLLAEAVEVGDELAEVARERRGQLRELGFELEEFGPGVVRLVALPAETPPARGGDELLEVLQALARGADAATGLEVAAASIACHSAVRFGDRLSSDEQARLLAELAATEPSITCPHGRPTRLLLSWDDLRRHFRRNY